MNYITCPKCKYSVSSESGFCSVCNYKFNTTIDEAFYVQSDKMLGDADNTNSFLTKLKNFVTDCIRISAKRLIIKFSIVIGLTLLYTIYHLVVYSSFDLGATVFVFLVCLLFFMHRRI